MTRTRQRFVWLVAVIVIIESALALGVALPLLADAGLEAAHSVLRLCHHAFRPHYLYPVTSVAVVLLGVVLVTAGRFASAARAMYRRTQAVTAPVLATRLPAVPVRIHDLGRSIGAAGRVDVLNTPAAVAFCAGLIRPRIYLSTGICALLNDAELTAVLLHEDYHRRRREPLRLVLLAGLGHALQNWPGFSPLLAEAQTEMEVAADAAAVARMGSPRALAQALLKVLEQQTASPFARAAGLAVSPLSPTAARIECLTEATVHPYPPLPWAYFGGLAGVLALATLGLATLATVSNLHSLLHPCHLA